MGSRRYTQEFKQEAINLVIERGISVAQAAEFGSAIVVGLAPSSAVSIHSTISPSWMRKKLVWLGLFIFVYRL